MARVPTCRFIGTFGILYPFVYRITSLSVEYLALHLKRQLGNQIIASLDTYPNANTHCQCDSKISVSAARTESALHDYSLPFLTFPYISDKFASRLPARYYIMFTQSSYSDYKRSTTYLIYWLSQASNTVIECLPNTQQDDSVAEVNTTGQVSCKELITMTKRVAANLHEEVPSTIFRLFRSVIKARSEAYEMFRELAATHADEKMEESNISHKHFIDRLDEAFAILGGEA